MATIDEHARKSQEEVSSCFSLLNRKMDDFMAQSPIFVNPDTTGNPEMELT